VSLHHNRRQLTTALRYILNECRSHSHIGCRIHRSPLDRRRYRCYHCMHCSHIGCRIHSSPLDRRRYPCHLGCYMIHQSDNRCGNHNRRQLTIGYRHISNGCKSRAHIARRLCSSPLDRHRYRCYHYMHCSHIGCRIHSSPSDRRRYPCHLGCYMIHQADNVSLHHNRRPVTTALRYILNECRSHSHIGCRIHNPPLNRRRCLCCWST
jgi:hypothetical protein